MILVMSACVALAQDWPGWRGAGRDGKLTGFEAPASWPKELRKGWAVEVGTGHSTPALVEGRLYVHARQGEDEVVLCLEAATGNQVWRNAVAVPYEMDPSALEHGKGPKSSPAVAGGRVFTFGISGILSALDAKTGAVLWRHDFKGQYPKTAAQYGTSMSPLVTGELVVAHVGGPGKGAIVAFGVADGKPRWNWDGDGPGYSSPVIGTVGGKAQLVTQTQSAAVGLSPADGALLWMLEFKTNFEQNSVSPILTGDRVILSGFKKGTFAYGIAGAKPERAWPSTDVSMFMSTPVLKGERLYGFSEKKSGQFFCLDVAGGKTLWAGPGRQGENAAVLDGGSVILALTTGMELVVFDASDAAYTERARWKVAESPTWAHPVVAGRVVYVKDEESLTRWTIP